MSLDLLLALVLGLSPVVAGSRVSRCTSSTGSGPAVAVVVCAEWVS